jgi:hypothetical protein
VVFGDDPAGVAGGVFFFERYMRLFEEVLINDHLDVR